MTSAKKFDVFLSHHSKDKPWVTKLKTALLTHGVKVWLDKDEIRPGDLFGKALGQGIRESSAIAIIISPESMKSGWVEAEYLRALTLAMKRKIRLIPVIYRVAKIPDFLTDRNWVDFRNKKGFEANVRRLVWGITGDKTVIDKQDISHLKPNPEPKPVSGERKTNHTSRSRKKQKKGTVPKQVKAIITDLIILFSGERKLYPDQYQHALDEIEKAETLLRGSRKPSSKYKEMAEQGHISAQFSQLSQCVEELQSQPKTGSSKRRHEIRSEIQGILEDLTQHVQT